MRGAIEFASFAVSAYDTATSVTDNVERISDLGARASRGLSGTLRGGVKLHRAAETARGRAQVHSAGEIVHGDGDRLRALAQLETDWLAFGRDVAAAAAAPDAPAPLVSWASANVVPTIAEWEVFRSNESAGWSTRFATSWDAFEGWLLRLRRLRELARLSGVILTSPEPIDLPKTIWQKGEHGSGGEASTLWTMLKLVVYAAVGITGVVTLYAVARDVKGGLSASTPAESDEPREARGAEPREARGG